MFGSCTEPQVASRSSAGNRRLAAHDDSHWDILLAYRMRPHPALHYIELTGSSLIARQTQLEKTRAQSFTQTLRLTQRALQEDPP